MIVKSQNYTILGYIKGDVDQSIHKEPSMAVKLNYSKNLLG